MWRPPVYVSRPVDCRGRETQTRTRLLLQLAPQFGELALQVVEFAIYLGESVGAGVRPSWQAVLLEHLREKRVPVRLEVLTATGRQPLVELDAALNVRGSPAGCDQPLRELLLLTCVNVPGFVHVLFHVCEVFLAGLPLGMGPAELVDQVPHRDPSCQRRRLR